MKEVTSESNIFKIAKFKCPKIGSESKPIEIESCDEALAEEKHLSLNYCGTSLGQECQVNDEV